MRKKLIIDNRYAKEANARWGKAYEIVPSPVITGLPETISSHPDMGFIHAGDVFVAEPSVYAYYKARFPEETVLCGKRKLQSHYPKDIAYNVLISEKTAFANLDFIDETLKNVLKEQGFELIHVKQGYAKCASVVFGKNIITADFSIKRAAEKNGFSVLEIPSGEVRLSGFDYGFLGGASGFFDDTLFFFGNIKKHSAYKKIMDFANQNGVKLAYMEDFPLTDVGTIVFV